MSDQQGPQGAVNTVAHATTTTLRLLDPNMLALVILTAATMVLFTWNIQTHRELQHREVMGLVQACAAQRGISLSPGPGNP